MWEDVGNLYSYSKAVKKYRGASFVWLLIIYLGKHLHLLCDKEYVCEREKCITIDKAGYLSISDVKIKKEE